jgi:prepilin-type N-terminal cleavage/methylation domain-containing protein
MKVTIKNSKLKIQNSVRESSIFNLQSLIKRRAFTLLEVLISLAIVSLTLVVLIHSQLLSIRQGTQSGYYTTAVFLGNKILTDTIMQENLIAGSEDDDFENRPEFSWAREVENAEIDELKKVKIVISGPENTQIILNTYYLKPDIIRTGARK